MPVPPLPLLLRTIPKTGETLPALGLGSWQSFDIPIEDSKPSESITALKNVLNTLALSGARLLDTSPMYGYSEATLGTLAQRIDRSEHFFWATKVWTHGQAASRAQMEQSRIRMQVKHIDLMQIHNLVDVSVHTPTLQHMKAEGQLRYIGITHYQSQSHESLERLVKTNDYDFVQCNFSILEPEAEDRLLPSCQDHGVAVIVNRPFAQAELFNKIRGIPLPDWSKEWGCQTWAHFFLKYILSHPAVTCVIPATSKVSHLEENLTAASGLLPGPADRKRMFNAFKKIVNS